MVPFWKEALDMVLDVEPGKFTFLGFYFECTAQSTWVPYWQSKRDMIATGEVKLTNRRRLFKDTRC